MSRDPTDDSGTVMLRCCPSGRPGCDVIRVSCGLDALHGWAKLTDMPQCPFGILVSSLGQNTRVRPGPGWPGERTGERAICRWETQLAACYSGCLCELREQRTLSIRHCGHETADKTVGPASYPQYSVECVGPRYRVPWAASAPCVSPAEALAQDE